jgi:hypothetical protein
LKTFFRISDQPAVAAEIRSAGDGSSVQIVYDAANATKPGKIVLNSLQKVHLQQFVDLDLIFHSGTRQGRGNKTCRASQGNKCLAFPFSIRVLRRTISPVPSSRLTTYGQASNVCNRPIPIGKKIHMALVTETEKQHPLLLLVYVNKI